MRPFICETSTTKMTFQKSFEDFRWSSQASRSRNYIQAMSQVLGGVNSILKNRSRRQHFFFVGGLFIVLMKAAPITDRKAERPKISACIRNLTRDLFPGISRAQNSHSAPPPPRCTGSSLAFQSHRSESRIPHNCP